VSQAELGHRVTGSLHEDQRRHSRPAYRFALGLLHFGMGEDSHGVAFNSRTKDISGKARLIAKP
jgi:hypothetical protein